MNASIWFSKTMSACSTVLYQSTICLKWLVRRTAWANLLGTIRFDPPLVELPLMSLLPDVVRYGDHRSMIAAQQSLRDTAPTDHAIAARYPMLHKCNPFVSNRDT